MINDSQIENNKRPDAFLDLINYVRQMIVELEMQQNDIKLALEKLGFSKERINNPDSDTRSLQECWDFYFKK